MPNSVGPVPFVFPELCTLGELTERAWGKGVQVMIDDEQAKQIQDERLELVELTAS